MRESILLETRERIQNNTWRRRITSLKLNSQLFLVLLQLLQWQQGCCHCSSLFLSTLTFSHSQFSHSCSQIIASFIGKHGEPLQHICQHGGVNKALNHGINYGTIHASTKHSTKHSGGWGICHNNGNFLTITPFAIYVGNCPSCFFSTGLHLAALPSLPF